MTIVSKTKIVLLTTVNLKRVLVKRSLGTAPKTIKSHPEEGVIVNTKRET